MTLTSAELTDIGMGVGLTTNFHVQYEDTLANQAQVIANANALLEVIENEFTVTTGWFNTPSDKFGTGKRQVVNLKLPVTFNPDGRISYPGASNNGYGNAINLDAQNIPSDPATAGRVQMVFINEWVEILMSLSNGKWNASDSSGEGLSQYCGILRFPVGHYNYYPSFVNSWLDSTRDGTFITGSPEGTDKNSVSYGCALLFLFYLNVQLGFSTSEIIQKGASTLSGLYTNLTGDSIDPFLFFKETVDAAFPGTSTITKGNLDNPFPLPSSRILSTQRYIVALPPAQRTGSIRSLITRSGKHTLRPTLNTNRDAAIGSRSFSTRRYIAALPPNQRIGSIRSLITMSSQPTLRQTLNTNRVAALF